MYSYIIQIIHIQPNFQQNIILEPSRVQNNEVGNLYNQTTALIRQGVRTPWCHSTCPIGCENTIAVLEGLEQNDKNKKFLES